MKNTIRHIVRNLVSRGIEMPELIAYLKTTDDEAVWLGYMDAEDPEDIL